MDGSTPRDDRNKEGDLDFDEELDESVLQHKHVVVNRSPIMMAWATIVCEQLNFSREEALSIGALLHRRRRLRRGPAGRSR